MAALTQGERMVKLETDVSYIKHTVEEVSKKLDFVLPTFVTKDELAESIKPLKKEISALKRRNWIQNTLSAVLGVTLTVLVQMALKGL